MLGGRAAAGLAAVQIGLLGAGSLLAMDGRGHRHHCAGPQGLRLAMWVTTWPQWSGVGGQDNNAKALREQIKESSAIARQSTGRKCDCTCNDQWGLKCPTVRYAVHNA